MQIGTRWAHGTDFPSSLPVTLHQAVNEAELSNPNASSWTLTWLEGRPIAQLDSLLSISISASGEVHVTSVAENIDSDDDDDDDWLSDSSHRGAQP